ncbi:hypothetical protein JCM16138_20170 [Thermococcus atlanticus]
MEDVEIPKERYDSLVFIGVRRDGTVEFVKVYAENREKAMQVLEGFFFRRGLHPADFVVIEQGEEDVSGKAMIGTRTEKELSATLARLGLKLVSNGVLYTSGRDTFYQITAVSRGILAELKGEGAELEGGSVEIDLSGVKGYPYIEKLRLFELREDVLVENKAGVDLEEFLNTVVRGTVRIPAFIDLDENRILVYDGMFHEKVSDLHDYVLVRVPVIYWDAYSDDIEDFKLRKVARNIYSAPLFMKAHRGYLILNEPPVGLVQRLLSIKRRGYFRFRLEGRKYEIPVDFMLVVETKDSSKYVGMNFPILILLPELHATEIGRLIYNRLGIKPFIPTVGSIPKELRTIPAVENIVRLVEKLREKNPHRSLDELIDDAIAMMTGGV